MYKYKIKISFFSPEVPIPLYFGHKFIIRTVGKGGRKKQFCSPIPNTC